MFLQLRMNVQAQRTHIEILEEKLRAAEERHEMFIEEVSMILTCYHSIFSFSTFRQNPATKKAMTSKEKG